MAWAWLGIIKQWLVLWKNLGLGDRSHCFCLVSSVILPIQIILLPSLLESCHLLKHHQDYSSVFALTVWFLLPEKSLLFLLSSLQFQTTKNRTSSSGEKRLDLDLGFWVEMNQGNLWVSCLLLPPVLFSKISKQISSSGKSPRFGSS